MPVLDLRVKCDGNTTKVGLLHLRYKDRHWISNPY